VVGHDLLLHVLEVHAPNALLVLNQWREDDGIPGIGQTGCKAAVGGGVNQHVVTPGAEYIECADHTTQHAVFIADVLLG